tara:strand:- start:2920 stop:3132 length:213 start_codon:yes stop_codon:yes gene_type:complete
MNKEIITFIFVFGITFLLFIFIIYLYIKSETDEKKFYNEYRANGYSYNPKPEKIKLEKRKKVIKKILKNG